MFPIGPCEGKMHEPAVKAKKIGVGDPGWLTMQPMRVSGVVTVRRRGISELVEGLRDIFFVARQEIFTWTGGVDDHAQYASGKFGGRGKHSRPPNSRTRKAARFRGYLSKQSQCMEREQIEI